jgi:hypothetical protein
MPRPPARLTNSDHDRPREDAAGPAGLASPPAEAVNGVCSSAPPCMNIPTVRLDSCAPSSAFRISNSFCANAFGPSVTSPGRPASFLQSLGRITPTTRVIVPALSVFPPRLPTGQGWGERGGQVDSTGHGSRLTPDTRCVRPGARPTGPRARSVTWQHEFSPHLQRSWF